MIGRSIGSIYPFWCLWRIDGNRSHLLTSTIGKQCTHPVIDEQNTWSKSSRNLHQYDYLRNDIVNSMSLTCRAYRRNYYTYFGKNI